MQYVRSIGVTVSKTWNLNISAIARGAFGVTVVEKVLARIAAAAKGQKDVYHSVGDEAVQTPVAAQEETSYSQQSQKLTLHVSNLLRPIIPFFDCPEFFSFCKEPPTS